MHLSDCSIKSLPLFGLLLRFLLKLTRCHGLSGQALVKTIHHKYFYLFSCVLQSYQPQSTMKRFVWQQHPGWTSLQTLFYGLLLGSVFGAGVAPFLVTFLFNNYKFNKYKIQSSAIKLSSWSTKRKIDSRQKKWTKTYLSLFFPSFFLYTL